MPTYVDVSALRIQTYLARWPSLRGRRGASAMLADATSWASIESVVAPRARRNDAAGEIDGKISLVLDDLAHAPDVALAVLDHLTGRLPAAEWAASWAEADDYPAAFDAMHAGARSGITTTPPLADWPLCRPCDLCGVSPAERRVRVVEEERPACADCLSRADQSDEIRGRTEGRLLGSFPGRSLAHDFTALASTAGSGKVNHLAHVYMDGNGIGRFFHRARTLPGGAVGDLSARLLDATLESLVEATREISPGAGDLAAVPHVLGGDDVLVSVPAPLAWRFATTLLRTFEERARAQLGPAVEALVERPPTASAAVVFAHVTYPFSVCVELATDALDVAKAYGGGRSSTVLWLDVTQEGAVFHDPRSPLGRRPWALGTLDELADALRALADLPASQVALLRDTLADPSDIYVAASLRRQRERLGLAALDPFFPGGTLDRRSLAEALDIVRWWR